jgi:hypothetical protein
MANQKGHVGETGSYVEATKPRVTLLPKTWTKMDVTWGRTIYI